MRDFKHTMDILVKSYLNDTLEHGSCIACAVGNIIAGNNGYEYEMKENQIITKYRFKGGKRLFWQALLDSTASQEDLIEIQKELNSIGYTENEILAIEYAFENSNGKTADDWMFNGLIAVLEVLAEIHGVDFSGKKIYEDQLTEIFNS